MKIPCPAEREGFEPPEPFSSTVFKTAVIDHSTTSPICLAISPSALQRSVSFKTDCKDTKKEIFCKFYFETSPFFWSHQVFCIVILSTLSLSFWASAKNLEKKGGDYGPRTSWICILLKYKLLQKSIVRGPRFFEGTANKVILHCIVSQLITKSWCLRSVERLCTCGINLSETTKLKTHTFPGDLESGTDSRCN